MNLYEMKTDEIFDYISVKAVKAFKIMELISPECAANRLYSHKSFKDLEYDMENVYDDIQEILDGEFFVKYM